MTVWVVKNVPKDAVAFFSKQFQCLWNQVNELYPVWAYKLSLTWKPNKLEPQIHSSSDDDNDEDKGDEVDIIGTFNLSTNLLVDDQPSLFDRAFILSFLRVWGIPSLICTYPFKKNLFVRRLPPNGVGDNLGRDSTSKVFWKSQFFYFFFFFKYCSQ